MSSNRAHYLAFTSYFESYTLIPFEFYIPRNGTMNQDEKIELANDPIAGTLKWVLLITAILCFVVGNL